MIRISFTPRFFNSFNTENQYFELSFFAHLNGQNLFLTVHVDSKNDISCSFGSPHYPDRIMNCIDIKHRINFRQRTFLPVFNLGQDFVCDIGNEAF